MTVYRVGNEGASVFDPAGRLLARLEPGASIVPGSLDETVLIGPRGPDRLTQRLPGPCTGYHDKVIRPERGRRS